MTKIFKPIAASGLDKENENFVASELQNSSLRPLTPLNMKPHIQFKLEHAFPFRHPPPIYQTISPLKLTIYSSD